MARLAISQRLKVPHPKRPNTQVWRYRAIEEARGVKTSSLKPPFFIRPTLADKTQPWVRLDAQTFEQAKLERDKRENGAELAAENADGRTTIAAAIEDYLDSKKRKNDSTVKNYTHILNECLEQLAPSIKFIDQVDRKVLNGHITYLEREKAAEPKTIQNKMGVIFQMLKAAGVPASPKIIELPTVEEEIAEPYTKADLKKLFGVMADEEMVRYWETGSRVKREGLWIKQIRVEGTDPRGHHVIIDLGPGLPSRLVILLSGSVGQKRLYDFS